MAQPKEKGPELQVAEKEKKADVKSLGDEKKEVMNPKQDSQNLNMGRKLLFLDVDGVLNSVSFSASFLASNRNDGTQDEMSGLYWDCLKRLKTIIAETDCYIILSSAWRHNEDSKELLFDAMKDKKIGIDVKKRYIADTPKLQFRRTLEIQTFLNEFKETYNAPVKSWCAVDDNHLQFDKYHFVHTNGDIGMTHDDMMKIIVNLNRHG